MRIRLVLLAVLALLPWQASAQTVVRSPASIAPLICQLQPGPGQGSESMALCVWSAAIEAVEAGADQPDADQPAGSWLRPGWGYKSGATLFVVGNMVAFSFPIWLAMGADAITITGVIIAGELIEAVGIFMLGEDALHAIKDRLVAAVDQLRTRFDHWRATSAQSWTAIAPERWTAVSLPSWD